MGSPVTITFSRLPYLNSVKDLCKEKKPLYKKSQNTETISIVNGH